MTNLGLKSERIPIRDYFEWQEMAFDKGWSDGFPVAPPLESKVAEVVEYLGREPGEVIGVIPPAHRLATIEKIAINSVMGGCKPEYAPVIIAAVQAMLEERFNLNGVQVTAHSARPLVIVSGPLVKQLGFNAKIGVFAGGSRANTTVGRAVRLILWNIGGAYTGDPDRASFGHPGRFSYCIAEDQDINPWEPLHVERGLAPEDSAVTVIAAESPRWIKYGLRIPGKENLENIADAMSNLGNNAVYIGGYFLVVIGAGVAPTLAREGWTKQTVRQFLYEKARQPLGRIRRHADWAYEDRFKSRQHWHPVWVDMSDDNCMIPCVGKPDDITVMTAGGTHGNVLCPGWHAGGGWPVTRRIELPRRTA